jgi:hypothetical protein
MAGKILVLVLHVLFCEACQFGTHGLSGHCEGFGTHGGGVGWILVSCLLLIYCEKAQSRFEVEVVVVEEEFQGIGM